MDTLYLEEVQLTHLVTHRVGNKGREEGLGLSQSGSRIKEDALSHLMTYFLSPFKAEEFFRFAHPVDQEMNEVFGIIQELFDRKVEFLEGSQSLAKLLYEVSRHPNIPQGQFHVAKMDGAILNGEELDMIGIFKSEQTAPFIKAEPGEEQYDILADEGYEIKGLDKGVLIFDVDREEGYKVLVHNAQRGVEARFWNDEFLQIIECNDAYHRTKEFMQITKEYVTEKLDEEFEVERTEQIDLLNRSVNFFKENEAFDKKEFTQQIFQDQAVIESFDRFEDQYRQSYSLEPVDSFEISDKAVKKQSRVFKSVLKLDKNFHVYIHGDKSLIERGHEPDGRKFYKIFYEKEH
ncbi:MAG: nucleoid-associated protein [Flavobacteriales bacterium]|nr:nucleoid-associated protein [Flavobacteriales bacterium]